MYVASLCFMSSWCEQPHAWHCILMALLPHFCRRKRKQASSLGTGIRCHKKELFSAYGSGYQSYSTVVLNVQRYSFTYTVFRMEHCHYTSYSTVVLNVSATQSASLSLVVAIWSEHKLPDEGIQQHSQATYLQLA